MMIRLLLCLLVVGCAGTAIRRQANANLTLIEQAREQGAKRCAPVELAMAESHNDFAYHALDEGNYHEAKREASIAEKNARIAIEKSPKERCVVVARDPGPGDQDGDGIKDPEDRCPRVPEDRDGYQDEDGCPEEDNDADGLADRVDKCPMDAEDRDNFEDDDGCPDSDNDQDGLSDRVDRCPADPEDKDGYEDDDGCPDLDNDQDAFADTVDKCPVEPGVAPDGCPKKYNLVVVTEKKIEIKQTVYFDTGKATIKPVSFDLLNEVAQALADNATLKVEVQGHTDSQGNDASNKRLSQKRAESVRTYLVKRGIPGDRMTARGYGEEQFIADNRTADGRAQNRRVEFVITSK